MADILEIHGLEVGYGGGPILPDMTLRIEDRARVLLMGPNGSGKSTLLKAVVGELHPSSGRILFRGSDITGWRTERIARAGIGCLLQQDNVFPTLPVRDNLRLAASRFDVPRQRRSLDRLLALFPLLTRRLDARAGLLSGGERQILALAMVLAGEPALLLLDEPTAGLSPAAAQQVIDAVQQAIDAFGVAALIVEHRVAMVSPLVSRAIGLAGGRIVLDDPTCECLGSRSDGNRALERLYFGSSATH